MPLLGRPDWVLEFGCYISAGHCASDVAPGGEYTRTYLTLSIAGKTVVESTTHCLHGAPDELVMFGGQPLERVPAHPLRLATVAVRFLLALLAVRRWALFPLTEDDFH
jgi:hypothetical protein